MRNQRYITEQAEKEFQSLFWWNDLMRGVQSRWTQAGASFQSLFWWNDLMSGVFAPIAISLFDRFNPCSGGMTL